MSKKKGFLVRACLAKGTEQKEHTSIEEPQGYIYTVLSSFQHSMLVLQPNSLDEVQRAPGLLMENESSKPRFVIH